MGLTTDLRDVEQAETVIISIGSPEPAFAAGRGPMQALRSKTVVLCMKGLEMGTGERLSVIPDRCCIRATPWRSGWPGPCGSSTGASPTAWSSTVGDDAVKRRLVQAFSSDLIRFYYGGDMIGNEVGAAAKNVVGIAAGFLDGVEMSSLKGALMSRGTREVAA